MVCVRFNGSLTEALLITIQAVQSSLCEIVEKENTRDNTIMFNNNVQQQNFTYEII